VGCGAPSAPFGKILLAHAPPALMVMVSTTEGTMGTPSALLRGALRLNVHTDPCRWPGPGWFNSVEAQRRIDEAATEATPAVPVEAPYSTSRQGRLEMLRALKTLRSPACRLRCVGAGMQPQKLA
jgi:hypothetical protein